jgi:hypothetical protein
MVVPTELNSAYTIDWEIEALIDRERLLPYGDSLAAINNNYLK